MDVVLQYFDSCPNWEIADARVKSIIERHGLDVTLTYQRVETIEEAERSRFAGSPTVLIDGRDPFGSDHPQVGLGCRVYMTPSGPAESPSVEQLERAMGV